MNDHSRRLVERVHNSIVKYTENKVDKYGLLQNISGNIEAIEENEIRQKIEKIANEIEDALWAYDDEEGKESINTLIEQVQEMLKRELK